MATDSDQVLSVERGGFPALGMKIGMIEATIDISSLAAANDRVQVFNLESASLVLAIGHEVMTQGTGSVTMSYGVASSSAGSATTLAGELAVDGTAGTKLASAVTTNVLVAADDPIVAEVSATCSAGSLRVWAIIADIENF